MTRETGLEESEKEVHFRPFRDEADFESISRIFMASVEASGNEWVRTAEWFKNIFLNKVNFDIKKDLVIVENDGKAIGYSHINWHQENDGTMVYRHGELVVPDWRGKGICKGLLRMNRERASKLAARHEGGPKRMRSWSSDTDKYRNALLEGEGHRRERWFLELIRDLEEPIVSLAVPMGLEVRTVTPSDYRKVFEAGWEANKDHWGARGMEESDYNEFIGDPNFQPDLWQVAWDGDKVAGLVLAWIDKAENKEYNRLWGYPDDIAVRRPYRRRGLARALLARSLTMLKDMGMTHANLGVDMDNPNKAMNLYSSVGFKHYKEHYIYCFDLD
jgi:GNAT superfamily N-acetyltransferase